MVGIPERFFPCLALTERLEYLAVAYPYRIGRKAAFDLPGTTTENPAVLTPASECFLLSFFVGHKRRALHAVLLGGSVKS
jgi:hypothetical protein